MRPEAEAGGGGRGGVGLSVERRRLVLFLLSCSFLSPFPFPLSGEVGGEGRGALLGSSNSEWDGIWIRAEKMHRSCSGSGGAAARALRAACGGIVNLR